MRTIEFDLRDDREGMCYAFGGYAGEHAETEVVALLPERMLYPWAVSYRFQIELANGEVLTGVEMEENEGKLSLVLPSSLTKAPRIKLQIVAEEKESGETVHIAKSPKMMLVIEESLEEKAKAPDGSCDPVPGLVIEETVDSASKNPVESRAIFSALAKKINRSDLVTAASGGIKSPSLASDSAPVSEQSVAKLALNFVKKSEYRVADLFDATDSAPLSNAAVTENLAPVAKRSCVGSRLVISDASALPAVWEMVLSVTEPKKLFASEEGEILFSEGVCTITSIRRENGADQWVDVTAIDSPSYYELGLKKDSSSWGDESVWRGLIVDLPTSPVRVGGELLYQNGSLYYDFSPEGKRICIIEGDEQTEYFAEKDGTVKGVYSSDRERILECEEGCEVRLIYPRDTTKAFSDMEERFGSVDAALDAILALQAELIGGKENVE